MDELSRTQWQTMIEFTEMFAVDGHLEAIALSQNQHFHELAAYNWTATATFLSSPTAIFQMVANDEMLIETNAQMQVNVVARMQRWTRLHIDLNESRYELRNVTTNADHHTMR